MKYTLRIASFALLITFFVLGKASAQPNGFDLEKLKAEKIAFFTNALSLTPTEAEKFWPIYNELDKKKFEIVYKRQNFIKQINEVPQNKSEKEIAELSRKIAATFVEEGKLSVEYNEKFLKVLPAKKVVLLFNADWQLRHKLLNSFRGPR